MSTNLDLIIDALSTAVEAVTPTALANVPFKRWRGPGLLGEAQKPAPGMRSFQWQLGAPHTPRTISGGSAASTWLRTELLLVVAYDLKLPRAFDTLGIGPALEIGADRTELWYALVLQNPISSSSYHCKRMVPLDPWEGPRRGATVSYRFDLEFARG